MSTEKSIESQIFDLTVFRNYTKSNFVIFAGVHFAEKHGLDGDKIIYTKTRFDRVEMCSIDEVVHDKKAALEAIVTSAKEGDVYASAALLFLRDYHPYGAEIGYVFDELETLCRLVFDLINRDDGGESDCERAFASFIIGRAFSESRGVVNDSSRAAEYYKKAISLGNPMAELFYYEALGDITSACRVAGKLIGTYPESHILKYYVAYDLYFGINGERDFEGAVSHLYHTARVERGLDNPEDYYFMSARYLLGLCYFHGHGVTADKKTAETLFRFGFISKTAMCGYAEAMTKLQVDEINNVTRRAVFELLRKSADYGYVPAVWKTAVCFYYGYGTEKDETLAKRYLSIYRRKTENGAETVSDLGESVDKIILTLPDGTPCTESALLSL